MNLLRDIQRSSSELGCHIHASEGSQEEQAAVEGQIQMSLFTTTLSFLSSASRVRCLYAL